MNTFYNWDREKNKKLILERNVSFEEVVALLNEGVLLDVIEHPNKQKYAHQKIYVVEINEYVYLVPFVQKNNEVFLKTIIPNRKAQKDYRGDK